MNSKKNGLTDSDKIFVTAALWISMITLFATAISLPMLPGKVTIFDPPDNDGGDFYSKYYNLFLISLSFIPLIITLILASFRKRGRLKNNFISMILFCIMLSLSFSSVIIYGINKQFAASSAVKSANPHTLVCIALSFAVSFFSAVSPSLAHAKPQVEGFGSRFAACAAKYWNVGAYGFLAVATVCSVLPSAFGYIPLGLAFIAYAVALFLLARKGDAVPEGEDKR